MKQKVQILIGTKIIGAHSIKELCANLKRPRKLMLLVKAGAPVDAFIEQALPFLEKGDIIIDGGNSHFPDTIRRCKDLEEKGFMFVGSGVSGGEEGARFGPSMMVIIFNYSLVVLQLLGLISRIFSNRLVPKLLMVSHAVIGSVKVDLGIMSRWFIMALSMVICKFFVKLTI